MRRIVMTRAGGYDPKLGPKHPDNQDPRLVESTLKGDRLTRTIRIDAKGGHVAVTEVEVDENAVTVASSFNASSVTLDATQLWNLAAGIVELFGGRALRYDDVKDHESKLREKIFDVLVDHEARCLDDNIDRDVVLAALVKAMSK